MSTRSKGAIAETYACEYLTDKGLQLVQRNFHCKAGEIDLIMMQNDVLVFVEVRMRNNPCFGSGAESVNPRKQHKIIATAQYYLQAHPEAAKRPARFDVVAITHKQKNTHIDWIENAFQA